MYIKTGACALHTLNSVAHTSTKLKKSLFNACEKRTKANKLLIKQGGRRLDLRA